jgi:hypothetical protein
MTDNITLPRAVVEQVREAIRVFYNKYSAEAAHKNAGRAIDTLDAALAEPVAEQHPEKGPALTVYNEIAATEDPGSPLERLRFFCSLAMRPQDWLDVAPFFDALAEPQPDAKPEPATAAEIVKAGGECAVVDDEYLLDFRDGFRAAERWHGIRKEDK